MRNQVFSSKTHDLPENVTIPVSQITKITRQAEQKNHFKSNKMLVPSYLNEAGVIALAKLSGLNPAEVKYKRPESPMQSGSTQNPML